MSNLRIGPPELSGGKVFWPVQEDATTCDAPGWKTIEFFVLKGLAAAYIEERKS